MDYYGDIETIDNINIEADTLADMDYSMTKTFLNFLKGLSMCFNYDNKKSYNINHIIIKFSKRSKQEKMTIQARTSEESIKYEIKITSGFSCFKIKDDKTVEYVIDYDDFIDNLELRLKSASGYYIFSVENNANEMTINVPTEHYNEWDINQGELLRYSSTFSTSCQLYDTLIADKIREPEFKQIWGFSIDKSVTEKVKFMMGKYFEKKDNKCDFVLLKTADNRVKFVIKATDSDLQIQLLEYINRQGGSFCNQTPLKYNGHHVNTFLNAAKVAGYRLLFQIDKEFNLRISKVEDSKDKKKNIEVSAIFPMLAQF